MAKKKSSANAKSAKSKAKSSIGSKHSVATKEGRTYSLEVKLIGGLVSEEFAQKNPKVSRTIQIRGDQTLDDLHFAIYGAFDRYDEHLYEFQFGKRPQAPGPRYSVPVDQDGFGPAFDFGDRPTGYTDETTIDSLALKKSQKFFYWFDFGDDWWHEIKVVGVDEGTFRGKPKVIKRLGESPPQYMDFDEE
jgi:hypothetical protein